MEGIVDIHTHILPGIDDGAKNWDISMQMLTKSAEYGVKKIIATPHYLPWKKNADSRKIQMLCEEAQDRLYRDTGIHMDIYPGNEILYHAEVLENLKKGKALTLAQSRYVLVEFSTEVSYGTLCRAVQNFREAGYIPIIAHVERYSAVRKQGRLNELREMGALFQMNAEVLRMGIFSETGRWAKKALQNEKIHFLASDMHNTDSRPPLSKDKILWIEKKLSQEYQDAILWGNSRKILE